MVHASVAGLLTCIAGRKVKAALIGSTIEIGRWAMNEGSAPNQLNVADFSTEVSIKKVSRKHIELSIENNECIVRCCGRNGVRVNGGKQLQRGEEARLPFPGVLQLQLNFGPFVLAMKCTSSSA